MRRWLPVLLWLFLPTSALAQAKVKGQAQYEPYKKIVLRAQDVSSKAAQFLWDIDGEADVEERGAELFVWAAPGKYRVRLTAIDFEEKKVERASFSFVVAGPTPPVPPGPGPGPQPPGPTPKGAFNRALILYESAEEAKMPKGQQAVLYSKAVRDYLKGHTLKDKDNANGAWRIWDKDVDAAGEGKV